MAINIHIVVFLVAWWFITNNTKMPTTRDGSTSQNLQTSRKICIPMLTVDFRRWVAKYAFDKSVITYRCYKGRIKLSFCLHFIFEVQT